MEPKQQINVVHATHPLNQQLFHMMATPREQIKANRGTSQVQCTTCFTARHKLQTCQRCKSVWYCSKECQKKDWPRHKTWCTPADRPKGMKKLVDTLAANHTLITILQACAALDLNLVEDTQRELGFKHAFMVRVDIAIEPADILSFVKLYLTDEPATEKMEGMVQLNRFHSHVPGRGAFRPLTEIRTNMWRQERENLNKKGRRNDPLGLVEFVNNDSEFSITMPLAISANSMKWAKHKEPFLMLSGFTGEKGEKPMTVATCMEFMNLHIRSDKKNELKLRAEMTDADKAIIRNAQDRSAKKDAVLLLREKMARESIYASMPL